MKTVGFPISDKENENRRALLPKHAACFEHPEKLVFEYGYGDVLGIPDNEYINAGVRMACLEDVLNQDIVCDPKIGDASYLNRLSEGQTIFGWIHAVQNRSITEILVHNKLTAYAWEDMFDRGRHVFWRNNELAGEAAILHAYQCYGVMPYETTAAVIGRGNTARGAIKALNMLGADVRQYCRNMEDLLRSELDQFDVLVNCVLWDVSRNTHIISRSDLKRMKKNALIIDVSCDRAGAIETSIPTTIDDPVYVVDNIVHYVVDHTPALYYKSFTRNNSETIYKFIETLMNGKEDIILSNAKIIDYGKIIDNRINEFQHR